MYFQFTPLHHIGYIIKPNANPSLTVSTYSQVLDFETISVQSAYYQKNALFSWHQCQIFLFYQDDLYTIFSYSTFLLAGAFPLDYPHYRE